MWVWWHASVIPALLQRAWGRERQAKSPEAHRQVDSSKQRQNKKIDHTTNKMKGKDQCPVLPSDLHTCSMSQYIHIRTRECICIQTSTEWGWYSQHSATMRHQYISGRYLYCYGISVRIFHIHSSEDTSLCCHRSILSMGFP